MTTKKRKARRYVSAEVYDPEWLEKNPAVIRMRKGKKSAELTDAPRPSTPTKTHFDPNNFGGYGPDFDPNDIVGNTIPMYKLKKLWRSRPKLLPVEIPPQNLPDLPPHGHVAPNACLQSNLFGLVEKGKRAFVKEFYINSFRGMNIWYTGEQLDQGDLDVLMLAIRLSANPQNVVPGNLIRFTVKGFLQGLGKEHGSSNKQWLFDSICRLIANIVHIEVQDKYGTLQQYGGSLAYDFYYEEENQTYYLRLNQDLGTMFERGWSSVHWRQRMALSDNLSKWLHGIYSSTSFTMDVETLYKMSRSNCERLCDFRKQLRQSLRDLIQVGAISFWEIDLQDRVLVKHSGNG